MAGNCNPPYCGFGTGGFCNCNCECCVPCPCYANLSASFYYNYANANNCGGSGEAFRFTSSVTTTGCCLYGIANVGVNGCWTVGDFVGSIFYIIGDGTLTFSPGGDNDGGTCYANQSPPTNSNIYWLVYVTRAADSTIDTFTGSTDGSDLDITVYNCDVVACYLATEGWGGCPCVGPFVDNCTQTLLTPQCGQSFKNQMMRKIKKNAIISRIKKVHYKP